MASHLLLDPAQLPDDITALKALLIAADKRAVAAEARATDLDGEIETVKLTIAKLRHGKFGNSSERTSVLMDQLELQLDELVARRAQETAADEIAAAAQVPASAQTQPKTPRRVPARRPLPANLPRERVIVPAPSACVESRAARPYSTSRQALSQLDRYPLPPSSTSPGSPAPLGSFSVSPREPFCAGNGFSDR